MALTTGMLVRILGTSDVGTLFQIREATKTCVIKLTNGTLKKNVPLDDVEEAKEEESKSSPIRLIAMEVTNSPSKTVNDRPPSSPSKTKASALSTGDVVEANYKGKGRFYRGKIIRKHVDGTFDIEYDDGDVEKRVEAENVKAVDRDREGGSGDDNRRSTGKGGTAGDDRDSGVRSPSGRSKSKAPPLSTGDVVEANYKGKGRFYRGKIIRKHVDGTFDIEYDDGDVEKRVEAENVKAVDRDREGGSGDDNRRSTGKGGTAGDDRDSGVRSPSGRSKSKAPPLSTGDVVEANYKGKGRFYRGKIIRKHVDGTFDIEYDDGDVEKRVEAENVKAVDRDREGGSGDDNRRSTGKGGTAGDDRDSGVRSPSGRSKSKAPPLSTGDVVEANYKGKGRFYRGKIIRKHVDGTFDIEYDDGDVEKRVEAENVKAVDRDREGGSGDDNRRSTGKGGTAGDDRDSGVRSPSGRSKSKAPPLSTGDVVEANYKGKGRFYRGKIIRKHVDGTFDIEYDDGDVEKRVEAENVKAVDRDREGGSGDDNRRSTGKGGTAGDDRDSGVRSPSGRSKSKAPPLSTGDVVEANYKGKGRFYRGKIIRKHVDGTFDIEYDDGDVEKRVEAENVKAVDRDREGGSGDDNRRSTGKGGTAGDDRDSGVRSPSGRSKSKAPPLSTGDVVEANYKGKGRFYRGKIIRKHVDGTFDIEYDDGDVEKRVEAENVKAVDRDREGGSGDDNRRSTGKGGTAGDDRDSGVRSPSGRSKSKAPPLSTGDVVEANYKGKGRFYRGKIIRKHVDGTFDIEYDDGDVEKRVEAENVKAVDRDREGGSGDDNRRSTGKGGTAGDDRDSGVRSPSGRSKSKAPPLSTGDVVEANYKGKGRFYRGKIIRKHVDGTFDIEYDDGDVEKRVEAENVKAVDRDREGGSGDDNRRSTGKGGTAGDDRDSGVRSPSGRSKSKAPPLSTGDVVEANYKGKGRFYRGKIIRKHVDGTFDIEYDDGDVEKRVEAENVKAVDRDREGGSGDDNRRSTGKGGTAGDDRDSGVRSPSGRSKSKAPPLSTGDVVEANYKGKGRFYRGKIIRKHVDGTFDIEYDDGDVEKRVEAENVKAVDRDREGGSGDDNRRSTGKGGTAGDDRDSGVRSPSGRSKSKAPPLSTGDVVEANYKGKGRFYRGKIIRKHVDGTFDIEYDDGDVEKRVEAENVKATGHVREDDSDDSHVPRGSPANRVIAKKAEKRVNLVHSDDSCDSDKGQRRSKTTREARVLSHNSDGTYTIRYSNGDVEEDAPTKALKRLRSSADSSQDEERGERRVKIPDESMSSTDRLFLLEQLAMTLYEEGKMKRKPRLSSDELSSESSNSSSGDSTDDSRPPNKTSIKPDRKMEQILRKLFDRASLQSFKRAFNEQDVKKAGRINRKKIIDVVGDLCKSELQDSAMGGFSIKRTLTQWFDSQYSLRASSAFDFSTFMLAFAVAKDRMCKQGMEKRLVIALEGRFASHHEHKRQLEMWQQKLGFRTFETLQRYFHDNALPRMFPARVRVREIGHIFNEVTRSAVPNKPVEVYLQQLRLHPHQTLLFTEFLCCYFQLYGSVDPRPPSWAAEQVDLRPVAFVASCLFSNGDPCCQRHGDLVRRLSVGRTPAQADLIIRFREAFEALTDTANGEKDTISSSQLETFGVNVVPDTSVLQPAFAALRKRTGMVSLVEIYATCGFVIDEVTSAPTVANAIEKLRLRNDVVDVRRIIGLIRNMCLKLLRFPNNPDYWRIRADSPAFQQKLGRFDGATNLLEAVGFVEYNKSHYEVRGARMVNGKRVSSLPKASLDLLRETCTELDAELSLLDGVESVASVLKRIGVERQRETPLSLDECEATLRHLSTYIDNVLKNPTDSRCWRIRASNKTFQRQIGYQPFSSDLMASIGYESISTSQGDVFVLRGTGSTVNSAASRPESDVSLSNFSFSRLSEQAEWFLWRRKQEIDSLLQDDMQYLIEGGMYESTLSMDVDAGSESVVLKPSAFIQKGALLRVGSEQRDLTEERLITGTDESSPAKLTRVLLHTPLHFAHSARELVFLMPLRSAEVMARARSSGIESEFRAFILNELLDQVFSCVSQQIVFRVPKEQRFENCSLGTFQQLQVLPISVGSRVVVGNNGCSMLLGWSNDDGYVEVSKIDSTSTKLVSRSLVLFDGGTDEKFTDTVDSFVDEHVGVTLQFARDKDRRTRQFQRTTRAVSNFIRVSTEERKFLVLCACDSVLVVNSSMMNSDNPAARLDFYLAAPCMMRPIRRWRAEQKVIRNDITLKKSRATVTKKTHQKEPFAGVSSSGTIERFQLSFDCSLVVYEIVQSRGIIWIAKADSGTLIGRINEYFSLVEGNTLWAMHSSQHLPGPVICIASPNAGHVSVWQVSLQSSSKLKSLHKQHVCQSEPTTRTAGASGSRTQVSALAVTSGVCYIVRRQANGMVII
ncbi:hypothetical protein Poli38472_011354 [Pythium oligandrum]|uniref:Uncharacterized protein n=1 Tax=Pythium oligandrum TaxID=41045 RepID=A0A8K1CK00_PYTOL|nr:hypothetical protein Poli38472_011354 [Pythium oligandrum]|eukprot:TMW64474.1 hypothetical protein Poli38472_011354 [Pythium oligandrum]